MYKQGFTLIETILYIALLGMLLSGVIVASYQLIDSTRKVDSKNITQQEGNFVIRKIDWALNGMTTVTNPIASVPYASTLDVVSNSATHVVIRFNSVTHKIEMSENGSAYQSLTTDAASTTAIQFHYIPRNGTAPAGMEASTTINGFVFYTKKYIRK